MAETYSKYDNSQKGIIFRCHIPEGNSLPKDKAVPNQLTYSEMNSNFRTLESMDISAMTYSNGYLKLMRNDGQEIKVKIEGGSGSVEGTYQNVSVKNAGGETQETGTKFLSNVEKDLVFQAGSAITITTSGDSDVNLDIPSLYWKKIN